MATLLSQYLVRPLIQESIKKCGAVAVTGLLALAGSLLPIAAVLNCPTLFDALQLPDSGKRRQLIESLVASTVTFYFAKEIQHQLRERRGFERPGGYVEGEYEERVTLLNSEDWQSIQSETLLQLLLDRALAEADGAPLYKTHPLDAFDLLFLIWPSIDHQPDVVTYIHMLLTQSPGDIHDLMIVCSESITMDGKHFLANVTRRKVAITTDLFGSYLYDEARRTLGDETVPAYPGDEGNYIQPTPEDRLRQFVYLYEHRESNPSNEVVDE